MCKVDRKVLIPIPDFIKVDPLCSSASDPEVFHQQELPEYAVDSEGRECFVIDECLAPALLALWEKGIKTTGCCCGHGSGSGMIGLLTDYIHDSDVHLSEAPPYRLYEVVERRRHENRAYERGRHDGLVQADREDIWIVEEAARGEREEDYCAYARGRIDAFAELALR